MSSKAQPLDIVALLQGTEYEDRAPALAQQISNAGLDDKRFINDLPMMGAGVGGNTYDLLAVILEQMEKPQPEPEITDAALALAEEHGLEDLNTIEGTGKDGAIIKSDIENLIA